MKKTVKKNSYPVILKAVIKEVKSVCEKDDRWKYHLMPMVKYAKQLAKKYHADLEVIELAAWLHDITRIKGDIKNHHITGSEQAKLLLTELGYDPKKIKKVADCIYAHRGSVKINKKNIEEEIVSCADAMSHFEYSIILFFSAFGKKNLSLKDGTDWIAAKTERSWKKISFPDAKKMMLKRYLAVKNILSYKA